MNEKSAYVLACILQAVFTGEAYYVPPGHVFEALEHCETVEFSPKKEFDPVMEVLAKNLEAMGQP
jgi:hypothetical protein